MKQREIEIKKIFGQETLYSPFSFQTNIKNNFFSLKYISSIQNKSETSFYLKTSKDFLFYKNPLKATFFFNKNSFFLQAINLSGKIKSLFFSTEYRDNECFLFNTKKKIDSLDAEVDIKTQFNLSKKVYLVETSYLKKKEGICFYIDSAKKAIFSLLIGKKAETYFVLKTNNFKNIENISLSNIFNINKKTSFGLNTVYNITKKTTEYNIGVQCNVNEKFKIFLFSSLFKKTGFSFFYEIKKSLEIKGEAILIGKNKTIPKISFIIDV